MYVCIFLPHLEKALAGDPEGWVGFIGPIQPGRLRESPQLQSLKETEATSKSGKLRRLGSWDVDRLLWGTCGYWRQLW